MIQIIQSFNLWRLNVTISIKTYEDTFSFILNVEAFAVKAPTLPIIIYANE